MDVHIVSVDYTSDQVLARLIRALIERTNWTVGPKPRETAVLNYYFPYLLWQDHKGFDKTPTAGWFTHRDDANSRKAAIWDNAAKALSLRMTVAQRYLVNLEKYGPTAATIPPVDHSLFQPRIAEYAPSGRPIVGVSGYTYAGGRKGEKLVADLMRSDLAETIDVVGSGQGWPCPTVERPFSAMGDFYRNISVYLCVASIEGIPLPPIEALACGVPIVIPRGVGLLDELPDAQNIYRYDKGDSADMIYALRRAVVEPVNRASLTAIASRFNVAAWAHSHVEAFERFLLDDPAPVDLPSWSGRAGVYTVAFGDPARACAAKLMTSVRKQMPSLDTAVVGVEPIPEANRFVAFEDKDIGARHAKTKIYDLAPAEWEYVIYLDADTEVVGDIDLLPAVLQDGFELVICTNPAQYHLAREMRRPDNQDEIDETFRQLGTDEILQLNGGVLAFRRCDRMRRFFERWHTEWLRYGKRDQAAFDRALYAEPVRVYVLGKEFNCITRYDVPSEATAICHYPLTARRWRGIIKGRLDSGEEWAALHPEPEREPPQLRRPRK